MSKQYRDVAKNLALYYLFGKWAISFRGAVPGTDIDRVRVKLVPLDGWIFDETEIIRAIADDESMKIEYES